MSKSGQQPTKADTGGQRADKSAKNDKKESVSASTPSAKGGDKEKSASKNSKGGTAKR